MTRMPGFFLLAALAHAQPIPLDWRAALNRIEAQSLRGHLSFLASDLLEGRRTPSRGLDVAAEYIAAQFRRAGLEPAGGAGSFLWNGEGKPRRRTNDGQSGEAETVPIVNVLGLLRGTDPSLRDTCLFVTAHADHVGRGVEKAGDSIYNGANDDASGTAAVLEIAASLARLPVRPRRSIVFMLFSGEELGLLGSRAFLDAPTIPLDKMIGNLNLEVLGRTDGAEGSLHGKATVSGFDYSTLTAALVEAGKVTGIEVFNHPKLGDVFFTQSDNASFARKGIPAHTLSSGYLVPDFHQPSDHWDKIDYSHLEAVTRTAALAVLMLADSIDVPRWNAANPKTEPYRNARMP